MQEQEVNPAFNEQLVLRRVAVQVTKHSKKSGLETLGKMDDVPEVIRDILAKALKERPDEEDILTEYHMAVLAKEGEEWRTYSAYVRERKGVLTAELIEEGCQEHTGEEVVDCYKRGVEHLFNRKDWKGTRAKQAYIEADSTEDMLKGLDQGKFKEVFLKAFPKTDTLDITPILNLPVAPKPAYTKEERARLVKLYGEKNIKALEDKMGIKAQ